MVGVKHVWSGRGVVWSGRGVSWSGFAAEGRSRTQCDSFPEMSDNGCVWHWGGRGGET